MQIAITPLKQQDSKHREIDTIIIYFLQYYMTYKICNLFVFWLKFLMKIGGI